MPVQFFKNIHVYLKKNATSISICTVKMFLEKNCMDLQKVFENLEFFFGQDDEIEASIKEVNRILENSGHGAESLIMRVDTVNDSQKALLMVEHKQEFCLGFFTLKWNDRVVMQKYLNDTCFTYLWSIILLSFSFCLDTFRNLNPENELKRIFGSRVVQAESS